MKAFLFVVNILIKLMANHTSGLFAQVDLFSRSRVTAFYFRNAIGNDKHCKLYASCNYCAEFFACDRRAVCTILLKSRSLTVEVSRSIVCLPDKFGTQVLYSC